MSEASGISKVVELDKGDVVYRQGEPDYEVYVIVRGIVKLKMKKQEFGDDTPPIVVQTLYDGDHLGEMALVKDQ